jgi:hypothetical protein
MSLQCLVKFLGAVQQIELVAEAAGEDFSTAKLQSFLMLLGF